MSLERTLLYTDRLMDGTMYTDIASRIREYSCCEIGSEKIPEKFRDFSGCQQISREENRQHMSTRIRGNAEYLPVYSLEEMGKEAWEAATGVRVLFHLESSNRAGTGESVFQRHGKEQYKVFQQFLEDHHAYEMMDAETKEHYVSLLKNITNAMDQYGGGGYNGISRNSMLLSQNMIAQLDYFNANYVPDELQDGFRQLIEECDYFNQNSRERMFADRMPCDIMIPTGDGGMKMRNKTTVINNYLEYSRQEKAEIRQSFSAMQGKQKLPDIYAVLQNIESQYGRDRLAMKGSNIFIGMKASWKKLICR